MDGITVTYIIGRHDPKKSPAAWSLTIWLGDKKIETSWHRTRKAADNRKTTYRLTCGFDPDLTRHF